MEDSNIEWTTHTFNPWRGCTKVSPGCLHCYAETLSKRNPAVLGSWGKGAPRVYGSPDYWKQPLKWNQAAADAEYNHASEVPLYDEGELAPYERPRVFCASLADWLDDEVPLTWLADLLLLVQATPNLDWLLLSKRPQNFAPRVGKLIEMFLSLGATGNFTAKGKAFADWLADWERGNAPDNIWIGTSVEDQTRADERIPLLLSIPAKVRFLSMEPLLGPVSLYNGFWVGPEGGWEWDGARRDMIQWVIVGGESGPAARPMQAGWARNLRDQCEAAGVSFFFKQWGEFRPNADDPSMMDCVGKKAAGRLLDGHLYDALPRLSNSDLSREGGE